MRRAGGDLKLSFHSNVQTRVSVCRKPNGCRSHISMCLFWLIAHHIFMVYISCLCICSSNDHYQYFDAVNLIIWHQKTNATFLLNVLHLYLDVWQIKLHTTISFWRCYICLLCVWWLEHLSFLPFSRLFLPTRRDIGHVVIQAN